MSALPDLSAILPLLAYLVALDISAATSTTSTTAAATPASTLPAAPAGSGNIIQQLAGQFISSSTQVLQAADTTITDVGSIIWVTVLMLGFVLYFTHVHRRLGKDLVLGGIAIGVLVHFIFPLIMNLPA